MTEEIGETLWTNTLDSPQRVSDWISEGSLTATFPSGRPLREGTMRRARAVVGRYASGYGDTSADHDRHLAEAFQSDGSRA